MVNDLQKTDLAANVVEGGGTLQQVKTDYTTAVAVQLPRTLSIIKRRVEEEADLAGAAFFYGWGAGKNQIEGPSVKMANALVRCYGNCAVDMRPVQETDDAWIFTAVFVDIETGFTLSRQFRQSKKSVVHGKHDEVRKDDIRFQTGQSKALRNVVLNAVPIGLVDAGMKRAKSGVLAAIDHAIANNGIGVVVDRMLEAFGKSGVTEERLLYKLGKPSRDGIKPDDLVRLKGDLRAIQDGQERAIDLFPEPGKKFSDPTEAMLTASAGMDAPAQEPEVIEAEPVEDAMTYHKVQLAEATTTRDVDGIEQDGCSVLDPERHEVWMNLCDDKRTEINEAAKN